MYGDSAIGLSFEYPAEWELQIDSSAFELEDGRIINSFNGNIHQKEYSENFDANIRFYNNPIFDEASSTMEKAGYILENLPIAEQMKHVKCLPGNEWVISCEELINRNGVTYVKRIRRATPIEGGVWDRSIEAIIPTGKYIMTFDIISSYVPTQEVIDTFDQVIDSIKLE